MGAVSRAGGYLLRSLSFQPWAWVTCGQKTERRAGAHADADAGQTRMPPREARHGCAVPPGAARLGRGDRRDATALYLLTQG